MDDPYSPPQTKESVPLHAGLLEVVRWVLIGFDLCAVAFMSYRTIVTVQVMVTYYSDGEYAYMLGALAFANLLSMGFLGSAWGLYRRRNWGWWLQVGLTLVTATLGGLVALYLSGTLNV